MIGRWRNNLLLVYQLKKYKKRIANIAFMRLINKET